jgi:hypothetical protein
MSSISTVAQSSDQHAAGSSSNPNEFVNQGEFHPFDFLFALLIHPVGVIYCQIVQVSD